MSSEILSDERIRRFNSDFDPVKEKMKSKGAKNSKERIFLWAILMCLRLAFGKPHHDFLAMVENQIGKFPCPRSSYSLPVRVRLSARQARRQIGRLQSAPLSSAAPFVGMLAPEENNT